MTTWQQGPTGYPGQGPPPPGFQVPYPQPPFPPQGGYPQAGYPGAGYPQPGYPQAGYPAGGFAPGAPPSYDTVYGGPPPPQDPGMYGTNYASEPVGDVSGFEFSDKTVRQGFIRKVYSILMVQLLITAGIISLFLFHTPTRRFVQQNSWLWILAVIISFAAVIAIACCGSVRRKAPGNYILLGVFTLAEGFMLGMFSGNFNSQEVFLAVAITAVLCFALTLFAFQTKWDFTVMGAGLFIAVICLMLFGFLALIFQSRIMTLVYASIGALIFSLYLIYDTQMIMGGKHKYSISPEEYVYASLALYMDIVNIFVYILTIIGLSRD